MYCGVHQLTDAYAALAPIFPPDDESFDRRPPSEGALAAFLVDADGRPVFGSQVLSSCAWAIGDLRSTQGMANLRLEGFDLAEQRFSERFEELFAAPDDDERAVDLQKRGIAVGRPIDQALLERCRDETAELVGIEGLFRANGVRIACHVVSERAAYRTEGSDFLNSFIADDLRRVGEAVGQGGYGAALAAYLTPYTDIDVDERIDLDECIDVVRGALAPDHAPAGRWPSAREHALASSQQLAVNEAAALLAEEGGVFAVNGPPGTGKTTMLRDLIAATVVARADRLADLGRPQDAFKGTARWDSGDFTHTVQLWDDRLTGFEIVVACATNGAAENISAEIPGRAAIDESWSEQADYFSTVASSALAAVAASPDTAPRAWGLVAACLGRSSNRHAFNNAFWFGSRGALGDESRPATLRAFLEGARDAAGALPPWREAVAAYERAKEAERLVAEQRCNDCAALDALGPAAAEVSARRAEAAASDAAAEDARRRVSAQEAITAACAAGLERRVQARRAHAEFRPAFVESLFTLGRAMRTWRAHDQELAAAVAAAEAAHEESVASAAQLATEAGRVAETAARCAQAWREATDRLTELETYVEEARADWGSDFPDDSWWGDRTRRELHAPWMDEEWNAARTAVFLAALDLHRAFLAGAAREMRASLSAAVDILGGVAPRTLPERTARAAWQSLFFVVPVVSTTFASFPQLFSHLSREALGWVFIDEAGQAAPQEAIGPLWRARRGVVVGDPLQLRPIVTLPFSVQQAIRASFAVDRTWLPTKTSVQAVADRGMRYGTYRGSADAELWVGAPLNVHRRCDEPMFSIVNEIAYQRKMVDGTPRRASIDLPPSHWIDVAGETADGHWVPAEGRALNELLSQLTGSGVDGSRMIAITPFRQVSSRMRHLANRFPGLRMGTIHTAQGREADVVVLVLGGDPRSAGAKAWAASEPNLLNVAVSRARRRLYVIGDRSAWAQHRFFDVLAQQLPARRPGQPLPVRQTSIAG